MHCSAYRNIQNLLKYRKVYHFGAKFDKTTRHRVLAVTSQSSFAIRMPRCNVTGNWLSHYRHETSHFGYARVKMRKSCQRSQNCDSTSLRWIKLKQNATFAPKELKFALYQRIPNGTQPCKHKMLVCVLPIQHWLHQQRSSPTPRPIKTKRNLYFCFCQCYLIKHQAIV